jgi:hypothetical protein
MLSYWRLIASAILLSIASQSAFAQPNPADRLLKKPLDWSTPDGVVHLIVPAGWIRDDVFMRARLPTSVPQDVFLEVSKGDAMLGQPGINCQVHLETAGQVAPGVTQEQLNARLSANLASMKMDNIRARTVGGVLAVDGVVQSTPRIFVNMEVGYIHKGQLSFVDMRCSRNVRGEIGDDDIKAARTLFDTLKVTP